jgi:hypothetical protein
VNFINFEPANCGTRSTRDFWTGGMYLRNGMIRNTRFTDCLGRSAILDLPAAGQGRKHTNYGHRSHSRKPARRVIARAGAGLEASG